MTKAESLTDPGGEETKNALRLLERAGAIEGIAAGAVDELRKDLKNEVEAKAADAFKQMTSRPDDYVDLRISDTYGLDILDENGRVIPTRSAGAEQVVALSLIDGLNRTGKGSGPVVMDTPFGRLDKTHRKNVMQYLPKTSTQLILFVHTGEVDYDDSIIKSLGSAIGRRFKIKPKSTYESVLERL